MMANASVYGEIHDKLWELSDTDKLFAQVSLPEDVIDMPELDDALLATHSACQSCMTHSRLPIQPWKVQNFAMRVNHWKIAHLHIFRRVF